MDEVFSGEYFRDFKLNQRNLEISWLLKNLNFEFKIIIHIQETINSDNTNYNKI